MDTVQEILLGSCRGRRHPTLEELCFITQLTRVPHQIHARDKEELLVRIFEKFGMSGPSITALIRNTLELTGLQAWNNHFDKFVTGSAAEFYIEPPVSCIGDVDVMLPYTQYLAFFRQDEGYLMEYRNGPLHSDRTHLWLFKSDPSCPGYVLHLGYYIGNHWIANIIVEEENNIPHAPLSDDLTLQNFLGAVLDEWKQSKVLFSHDLCGPAGRVNDPRDVCWSRDQHAVYNWPAEASEWPNRFRKYNLPDRETVSLVARTNCHVVHKSPSDQTSGNSFRWRISFSAAEVILLNRWIPEQQIVYHMLRYFSKRELEIPDSNNKIVCSYHLKTLMLWKCEELPIHWWKDTNLIAICCGLLKCLLKWVTRGFYPNYFMRNCNLLEQGIAPQLMNSVVNKISSFAKREALSDWFKSNYSVDSPEVDSRSTGFSHMISRLSSRFSSTDQYMSKLINSHVASLQYKTADFRHITGSNMIRVKFEDLECMPYFCCISDVTKVHRNFVEYYKSHVLLQASSFQITHKNHDRIFQVLCSLYWRPDMVHMPKPLSVSSNLVHKYAISILKNLSKVITTETDYFLRMKLAIKLCKKSIDGGKHEIVFLAALYHAAEKDSKCLEMIRYAQAQAMEVFYINSKYLLFIDDISHIHGFLVLYCFIRRTKSIVLISTDVLLQYFDNCLSIESQTWYQDSCGQSQTRAGPTITCLEELVRSFSGYQKWIWKLWLVSCKPRQPKRRARHVPPRICDQALWQGPLQTFAWMFSRGMKFSWEKNRRKTSTIKLWDVPSEEHDSFGQFDGKISSWTFNQILPRIGTKLGFRKYHLWQSNSSFLGVLFF